jgi:hypothetical protein
MDHALLLLALADQRRSISRSVDQRRQLANPIRPAGRMRPVQAQPDPSTVPVSLRHT